MGKKLIDHKRELDIRSFILTLATVKGRAAELEMWRTHHMLDDVLSHAGWELARLLGEEKTK